VSKRWIGIVALAAIGGGCATERDSIAPTELERSAALELVGQMSALHRLSLDPTDRGRLIAVIRFDPAARLIASNRAPVGWSTSADAEPVPECVTATNTTATFSGCEIDGHWVDGTISRAGPTVDAEIIDVFILDTGSQGAASIDGELILTGDSIAGAVNIDASWSQDQRDITLHAGVEFAGVVLDDRDCPVAGSVTLDGTLSAPPRVAEVTVQFGPDCGDIQISR